MGLLVVALVLSGVPVPQECEAPPLRDVTALRILAQKSGALSVGHDSVATWCFDSQGAWSGGQPVKAGRPADPNATPSGDCARAISSCEAARADIGEPLKALLKDALDDLERPYRGQKYVSKRSGLGERPADAADCRSKDRSVLFALAQARMDIARLASMAQSEYGVYRTWLLTEQLKCGQEVRARPDATRLTVTQDAPAPGGAGGSGAGSVAVGTGMGAGTTAGSGVAVGASGALGAGTATSGGGSTAGVAVGASAASGAGTATSGGVLTPGVAVGASAASGAGTAARGGVTTAGPGPAVGASGATASGSATSGGVAATGAGSAAATTGAPGAGSTISGGVATAGAGVVVGASGAPGAGSTASGGVATAGAGAAVGSSGASGAGTATSGGVATAGAGVRGGSTGAGSAAGSAGGGVAAGSGGAGTPGGSPVTGPGRTDPAPDSPANPGTSTLSGARRTFAGVLSSEHRVSHAIADAAPVTRTDAGTLVVLLEGSAPVAPARPDAGPTVTSPTIAGPTSQVVTSAAPTARSTVLERWRGLAEHRAQHEADRDYTLGFLASHELAACRCERQSPSSVLARLEAGDAKMEAGEEKAHVCEDCAQAAFDAWKTRVTKQCALVEKLSDYEVEVLSRSLDAQGLPPRCFDVVRARRPAGKLTTPTGNVSTDPRFVIKQNDPAAAPAAPAQAVVTTPMADSFLKAQDWAPVPVREDGRLYVRLFMSSACRAEVLPGPIEARTGDLLLIPWGSRRLSVRSSCGGLAEVYWGREARPRVSEIFGRSEPLVLEFKPQ